MSVTDFAVEGAVGLELGGAVSTYFGHFVVSVPGEVDTGRIGAARLPDMLGAAAKGELARPAICEQDVIPDPDELYSSRSGQARAALEHFQAVMRQHLQQLGQAGSAMLHICV